VQETRHASLRLGKRRGHDVVAAARSELAATADGDRDDLPAVGVAAGDGAAGGLGWGRGESAQRYRTSARSARQRKKTSVTPAKSGSSTRHDQAM